MVTTSIIIPSIDGRDLLEPCVSAIRQFTPEPYEMIVVDNGSSDSTLQYCREEKITFASLPSNRGFPAACNLGLRLATGDALLLLNNDVIVTHNWLGNMLNCLYSSDRIGIVGPYSNYVSGRQQLDSGYVGLEEFHAMAQTRNAPDPQKWRPIERLVGFCFLFKRELYDRIGGLDERYSPGHYEDDDYCYHARKKGYQLLIAGDVIVHHHGSASFKKRGTPDIYKLIKQNRKKFMEKWDVDPHNFMDQEGGSEQ